MKRHVWISQGLVVVSLLSIVSIGDAQRQQGVWEERNAPMPTKRQGYATSAVNGKIYAIGGYLWHDDEPKLGRVLGTVEEYDPAANQWRRRANMRIARAYLSSSAIDGIIYAIGGEVQMWWSRKHVEVYNPVADIWMKKADMLTARTRFNTSVADGKIFAVDHQSVEAYDPVADVWQKRVAVPTKRSGLRISVVGGVIYAIGGWGRQQQKYLDVVEAYDPATGRWSTRAEMPQARGGFTASVVGGKIYVMGGRGSDGNRILTIDVYDPETNTWKREGETPDLFSSFTTCVVDGKIYVFAGVWDLGHSVLVYTPPAGGPQNVNPARKLATTWGQMKVGR